LGTVSYPRLVCIAWDYVFPGNPGGVYLRKPVPIDCIRVFLAHPWVKGELFCQEYTTNVDLWLCQARSERHKGALFICLASVCVSKLSCRKIGKDYSQCHGFNLCASEAGIGYVVVSAAARRRSVYK
jgi:hypothetical protein